LGYAFLDHGDANVVTVHYDLETRYFILSIQKGNTTLVIFYENKLHYYQESDDFLFLEVEGMI